LNFTKANLRRRFAPRPTHAGHKPIVRQLSPGRRLSDLHTGGPKAMRSEFFRPLRDVDRKDTYVPMTEAPSAVPAQLAENQH